MVKVKVITVKDEINPMEDIETTMTITEYANLITAMKMESAWYSITAGGKTFTIQPARDIKRVELEE